MPSVKKGVCPWEPSYSQAIKSEPLCSHSSPRPSFSCVGCLHSTASVGHSRVYFFAYFLSLLSGVSFWITLNSIERTIVEQLWFQTNSTLLAWLVLVLIVNENVMYPTRQQWLSLFFYLLTELSIAFQVRLVIRSDTDQARMK